MRQREEQNKKRLRKLNTQENLKIGNNVKCKPRIPS